MCVWPLLLSLWSQFQVSVKQTKGNVLISRAFILAPSVMTQESHKFSADTEHVWRVSSEKGFIPSSCIILFPLCLFLYLILHLILSPLKLHWVKKRMFYAALFLLLNHLWMSLGSPVCAKTSIGLALYWISSCWVLILVSPLWKSCKFHIISIY